ncbi:MAG: hypothetical protein IKF11_02410 [Methanobrevibacter sp.]|nr:hypothetical protein [Methanobrevibacter sp.]
MHVLEKAFIDLLRNNLSIPDEKIFTGSRYKPIDVTPCITVNQASEVQVSAKQMSGPEEFIRLEYDAEVWINIWCNTEEQRTTLIDEVELRIFQALANHYTTCSRYADGDCTFLEDECATLNITNGRTAKNQCPYPHTYEYCSWFKKNQIIKHTFAIDGKQDMDELDLAKPVLRTIIKVDMTYYQIHIIGGHPIGDLILDDKLFADSNLADVLKDYDYIVMDLTYDDESKDWDYSIIPVEDVTCLADIDGAVKNLVKVGGDVSFERFKSTSTNPNIGKSEYHSLAGLLVAIVYDDYTVKYANLEVNNDN